MKFKNYYIFFLLAILLMGCDSDNPKINILNSSGQLIDSLRIGMSQKYPTTFKNISPNKQVYGKISTEDDSLGDGAYFIEVYFEDKTSKKENFGYFTNGKALNYRIDIEIKSYTIFVNY